MSSPRSPTTGCYNGGGERDRTVGEALEERPSHSWAEEERRRTGGGHEKGGDGNSLGEASMMIFSECEPESSVALLASQERLVAPRCGSKKEWEAH